MGITREDAFPSKFLKQAHVPQPTVLTIAIAAMEDMPTQLGKKLDRKPVLHFAEDYPPMVLNATNWDFLSQSFGPDTDDWAGGRVEVYIDPTIRDMTGKLTGGLRLRAPGGAMPAARPAPAAVAADILTWPQALALAATVGIEPDRIKALLKARGNVGYTAARDTATVRQIVAQATQQEEAFVAPAETATGDDRSVPF